MTLETLHVGPAEQDGIIELLLEAFEVGPGSPLADARLFDWKVLAARPDSSQPRGYVTKKDGQPVAYSGLWPVALLTPAGPVPSGHIIDWVARPGVPGVGIRLLKQMVSQIGPLLTLVVMRRPVASCLRLGSGWSASLTITPG